MSSHSTNINSHRLVLPKEKDINPNRPRTAHPDANDDIINNFFIAADRSDLKVVEQCLQAGVPINVYNMAGRTVFHIAASTGNIALVDMIINYPGRNLNIRSFDFMLTPLHEAVLTGREEIVKKFLKAGAKINIPNGHGSTAVHMAVRARSVQIIRMLIIFKANLNVIDAFSNSPLSIAILDLKDIGISQSLLRHGARVNKNRPHALYLFHEAILNCMYVEDILLLKLLVRHGAFVNYVDASGRNALHYAAIAGMPMLIKYLLHLGVKTTVEDKTHRTPYEMAKQHEHYGAVEVFNAFTKDP